MKKWFVLVITMIGLIYWRLWIPEIKAAGDLLFWYPESLESLGGVPMLWREILVPDGFGQYIAYSLWIWPILFLYGLLSDVDFSVLVTLMDLVPFIILGSCGIYNLLSHLKIKGWASSIGTLFYLSNTYILLLIDGGQVYLSLAYAMLPWVFLSYLKSIELGALKNKLIFIAAMFATSVFDIRVLYFIFILIFLSFIFDNIFYPKRFMQSITAHLSLGVCTGLSLVFFHLAWILPSLLAKGLSLPMAYDRLQQVEFLSFSSLGHSLFLLQPNWYLNIFGKVTALRVEFFIIPVLVFLAPILQKRNKNVLLWSCVALLSIFLTKGSQQPFGDIYKWLFDNVPGFVLFRDPSKFYFLSALSYSVLIAFTVEAVGNLKSKFYWLNKAIYFSPLLIFMYLVLLARPAFLGEMTGLFSSPLYKEDYAAMAVSIGSDQQYSRILYIPHQASLGYSSPTHPAVDGLSLIGKRPFALGVKGTYEAVNFLREAPFMGQLLDITGVSYLVFPPLDPRRDDMHPDNIRHYYKFINQISVLPWIEKREEDLKIPVLKTQEHQDKFFLASNLWWVIGSDSIYQESTKSANLKLSNNALVFTEEIAGLGKRLEEFTEAKIVLNNKSLNDLAAIFINSTDLTFPAQKLDFNPDKSGWWKREAIDLMWWRNFLQSKYGIDNTDFDLGGGWAISEGDLRLDVQNKNLKQGSILLARVMESSRGGQLKFYQGDILIGEIGTNNLTKALGESNVRWFEVGKLSNDSKLTLASKGDINVVNALAILDSGEWESYKNKAEQLKSEDRIIDFFSENATFSNGKLEYQKIDSTKYKVKISGLNKPKFFVFSQSYDALWKMNGQEPLPVYSLLGMYRVEKDGEYEVEFEAQKYVYPGFIISLLSITGFSVLLFLSCRRKKTT